jgi:hypothetical protein
MSDELDTEIESNTTTDTGADRADSPAERHSDDSRERGESVRDAIKSAWAEQTGSEPEDSREASRESRRKRDERKEWERPGRAARAAKENAAEDAAAREDDANKQAADATAQSRPAAFGPDGSPVAWNKDARAEWQRLPKSVQDAIVKREKDTAAGVEAIKNRVAAEERAWQPYDATIRQFGMDRPATITRMMQWHDSLMRNPVASYPALARSQGHDPKMIVASVIAHNPDHFPRDVVDGALQGLGLRPAQQAQAQHGQQQQTQQGYDPRFVQYAQNIEQRLGMMEHANNERLQAQTMDTLMKWAADKPHFQTVRYRMGEILSPNPETGRSIIPLKQDGSVDLDSAYDFAVRTHPTLGEAYIQDRIAQERKAASDAAAKARRAGSSFAPSSPGRSTGSSANKQQRGKSVRESLNEAIQASRGNERY